MRCPAESHRDLAVGITKSDGCRIDIGSRLSVQPRPIRLRGVDMAQRGTCVLRRDGKRRGRRVSLAEQKIRHRSYFLVGPLLEAGPTLSGSLSTARRALRRDCTPTCYHKVIVANQLWPVSFLRGRRSGLVATRCRVGLLAFMASHNRLLPATEVTKPARAWPRVSAAMCSRHAWRR